MSEQTKDIRAPRMLTFTDGNKYYRIGGTTIPADLGTIFYCAENNSTLRMDKEGFVETIDFKSMFYKKLFKNLTNSRVYIQNDIRYGHIILPIITRTMSTMKLKNKRFLKKVNGRHHTVIAFKTPEEMAQFRTYFNDYFVE